LKVSTEEVSDHITRLAKKGLTPSQIGIILRDSHGIAQVKNVTGNKILRILKANGMHVHMSEILQLSFIIINIDYTACLVATRTTGTADSKATLLLLLAQPTPIIIIIIIYSLTPSVSMLMIAF
jgi:small subunit ribosomal protein S13e